MNLSIFARIRRINKLTGLSYVKKVGVLSIPNCGEFVIPAATNGYFKYIILTRSPFDYNPIVIVSPQRDFPLSSYSSNTQLGELSINILFQEVLGENLLVRFYFPQL